MENNHIPFKLTYRFCIDLTAYCKACPSNARSGSSDDALESLPLDNVL